MKENFASEITLPVLPMKDNFANEITLPVRELCQ